MKILAILASLLVAPSVFADWGDATGGSTPSVPQVCIFNQTPYSVELAINGQRLYVSPQYSTRIPSYTAGAVLLQMNTRQLSGPYSNPIWTQTYVNPAYYGCGSENSVSIFLYGDTLGFR
ncbi:hypothetical protein EBU99_07275 [bacterium]|nr:hypothetical protein [bacterium]